MDHYFDAEMCFKLLCADNIIIIGTINVMGIRPQDLIPVATSLFNFPTLIHVCLI